jgi:tripartite ATP-independent transporter DctP family solute receptor
MTYLRNLLLSGMVFGTAAMASAASAQELTFGMQNTENDNVYKGAVAMGEKLEELSGGTMSLKIFPGSQLGDFKAMTAQVQEGELDFTTNGYPDMSYIIPELALIGEPYVVSDYDHLLRVIEGPYGQKMNEEFNAQGVNVLDVWYFGTRHTTANKPINSIQDMQGLRLRTPNVPFLIDYAEAVGATPAPVAVAEVYLALQTNQVDAQENPLPTIQAMKFYEVQNSIALTGHFVASQAVIVSSKTWQGLSEEQRRWIVEAVEAGRTVNNELTMKDEANLISFFEKEGLTVTQPDLAPFREAMQPYYDKLEAKFGEGSIAELMNQ